MSAWEPSWQAPDGSGWPLNERATMRVWFAEIADGEPRPLEDHDELALGQHQEE